MKRFLFRDTATNREFVLESESIVDAFLVSLEMVMDGTAVHPVFVEIL